MKLSLMMLLMLFASLAGCGGGNSEVIPGEPGETDELSAEELEVEESLN